MGTCWSLLDAEQSFLSNDFLDCALYATQGNKEVMEDRNVVCLSLPIHTSYALFGIFDGFNGGDASTYLSKNIANALDALTDLDDNKAIINTINEMDTKWIHRQQQCNENSGSVFVFALINTLNTNNSCIRSPTPSETDSLSTLSTNEYDSDISEDEGYKVRVFWAGDSRAILMKNNLEFENLTVDHHCDVEKEAKRILKANGRIKHNRIDGKCAVTRAFGCYKMKNNALLSKDKQKMIVEPEYTEIICRRDDRLVIFCDGFMDLWSEKRLKQNYKHYVLQQRNVKKGLLNALMHTTEQAIFDGAMDNMSMVSVRFK